MKIEVHIRQQSTTISVGDGSNTVRWLADSALIWFLDHQNSFKKKTKINSPPIRVTKNTGQQLEMNKKISECLENNQSVYVYLKQQIQWQKLGKGL